MRKIEDELKNLRNEFPSPSNECDERLFTMIQNKDLIESRSTEIKRTTFRNRILTFSGTAVLTVLCVAVSLSILFNKEEQYDLRGLNVLTYEDNAIHGYGPGIIALKFAFADGTILTASENGEYFLPFFIGVATRWGYWEVIRDLTFYMEFNYFDDAKDYGFLTKTTISYEEKDDYGYT